MSSQESQEKPGGNTGTPGKNFQNYRWFLSIPVKEEDNISASQLSQHFKGFCKKYRFQKEKGEKTGYVHWQCEISLKTKEYRATAKNLIGFHDAHLEPTQNYFASNNYCGKDETRIEGPYDETSIFVDTPKLTQPWQFDLKKKMLEEKPDYRRIYWIYDEVGGGGKSDFCMNLYDLHDADLFNNGKFSDIAYALGDNPKVVLFDLPRVIEERVNYTAIEAVKTGFIFSGKYESKGKRFNKPHVCVMANFPPDYKALSKGRWIVWTLTELGSVYTVKEC